MSHWFVCWAVLDVRSSAEADHVAGPIEVQRKACQREVVEGIGPPVQTSAFTSQRRRCRVVGVATDTLVADGVASSEPDAKEMRKPTRRSVRR